MSTRKDRSVPWILRYRERKDLSKKIRKTEAAVKSESRTRLGFSDEIKIFTKKKLVGL